MELLAFLLRGPATRRHPRRGAASFNHPYRVMDIQPSALGLLSRRHNSIKYSYFPDKWENA